MKVLLTTLNAKYIHSSLALRYLKAYCRDIFPGILLEEFTINDRAAEIAGEIFKTGAETVAFACYIWNITQTLEIASILKKVNKEMTIILGGPEVSYDAAVLMGRYPYIDYIVTGEGEETFRTLLTYLANGENNLSGIDGLVYRTNGMVRQNRPRALIKDLDSIPSPFQGELDDLEDKIVYYESARGCPFQCQYCLSSTFEGVRFFSLPRVKADLKRLIEAGVKQVKFVDRTFNCKKEHAMEIWRFLMENRGETRFHFEISADLLDEEMLNFLATVPNGLFQFEIGVQSTNPNTLKAIKRRMNFAKLAENVCKLGQARNIHLHLDLIAGLPEESYALFRQSFNDVYALGPQKLQLGFLKLLKGSGLRERADDYGYVFNDTPPYEVLQNRAITYGEILRLKRIEDILEKYGNSHKFTHTLQFIQANYFATPFDFYEEFADYWEKKGLHKAAHSDRELYTILHEFFTSRVADGHADLFRDILKFDYLLQGKSGQLPDWCKIEEKENFKERCRAFLGDPAKIEKYLPELKHLAPKQLGRLVHIENFGHDVLWLVNHPDQPDLPPEPVTILFAYHVPDKTFVKARYFAIEI